MMPLPKRFWKFLVVCMACIAFAVVIAFLIKILNR